MTRAGTAWHLSYNDRWAAVAPDKWPCLSPIEALAQCTPTQSHISLTHLCVLNSAQSHVNTSAQVSCHPLHHKLKLLTCPRYNQKINGGFFPLRLIKTNQLSLIYCNKDASALDEAEEMLRTSVIRFSSEGKSSADRARAFVFIEWLLCEVHPCLVTPSSLPAGHSAPTCKVL